MLGGRWSAGFSGSIDTQDPCKGDTSPYKYGLSHETQRVIGNHTVIIVLCAQETTTLSLACSYSFLSSGTVITLWLA